MVETAKTASHFQRAVLRIDNFLIMVTVGLVLVIALAALFRRCTASHRRPLRPLPEERWEIVALVDRDAAKGFRTLGVARSDEIGTWRYLGLLPLFDPPRDDCAETIAATRAMGVIIKMVTGDHGAIAMQVARQLKPGDDIVVAEKVCRMGPRLMRPLSSLQTGSRASFPNMNSRS